MNQNWGRMQSAPQHIRILRIDGTRYITTGMANNVAIIAVEISAKRTDQLNDYSVTVLEIRRPFQKNHL